MLASSVIDVISRGSPVASQLAMTATAVPVAPTDRQRAMLIGTDYERSEPSLEGCETSFHRPIAQREKTTESSLAGVPDV